jgi:N-methylhydantoinase A
VPERADYKGAITQELDEAAAEAAIRFLIDSKDIEAIAVSFLWSFYNADDERKVKKLLEHIAHGIYCTLSSDIAPLPGEYERSSTTAINAYAGRITNFLFEQSAKPPGQSGLWWSSHGHTGLSVSR